MHRAYCKCAMKNRNTRTALVSSSQTKIVRFIVYYRGERKGKVKTITFGLGVSCVCFAPLNSIESPRVVNAGKEVKSNEEI